MATEAIKRERRKSFNDEMIMTVMMIIIMSGDKNAQKIVANVVNNAL